MTRFVDAGAIIVGILGALVIASDTVSTIAQIAEITPLLALTSIVLTLFAAIRKRPLWIVAFAFVGTAAATERMVPDLLKSLTERHAPTDGSPFLKVMTVNVWADNFNRDPLITLIETERPDIIVAQEVFHGWKQSLSRLFPAYAIVAGCTALSDCNVVILSRLPSIRPNTNISSCCAVAELQLPPELGGGRTKVLGLHMSRTQLSQPQSVKKLQAETAEVLERAKTFGAVDFLAGDINAAPWSALVRALDQDLPLVRRTHLLPTWPARLPFSRFSRVRIFAPIYPMDHVYAGCGWRTVSVHRGPDIGSDHYPVIAAFARADAVCRP